MTSTTKTTMLSFTSMHPTFRAFSRTNGLDFTHATNHPGRNHSRRAKYGVLVFRNADLDNERHIAFSAQLAELEDVKAHIKAGRKMHFPEQPEIFEIANVAENGKLLTEETNAAMKAGSKGNMLWHADMAYNPRCVSYSTLRAVGATTSWKWRRD